MCDECGCNTASESPKHGHDHAHPHPHAHHPGTHDSDAATSRTVTLKRKVLSRNDEFANLNRTWLHGHAITTINLISSPGSGKTFLLEKTLDRLQGRVPCAVITGDVQTDNDARRLMDRGAPVRQIETHGSCHLDAARIHEILPEVIAADTRILFIENVGNLVCPAAFDLGEDFKVALLSSTEGEDKPLKYPTLFSSASVAVLTKTDLIPHLDWNRTTCRENLRRVHPGIYIFELSARTGDGMDAWIDYLVRLVS